MPNKTFDSNKMKNKIEKLISKYDYKNKKQEKYLEISKDTQNKLELLLKKVSNNSSSDNGKELHKELKSIHKNHKNAIKKLKNEEKKDRKLRKKEKYNKKKERQNKKKDRKIKKEKVIKQLELSRVEKLPELKNLVIIIDGWNITGCDKIARKCMRGKRGSGAQRMISLVKLFLINNGYIKNNSSVSIDIHFDGNGKDKEFNENNIKISVKYSGKKEIVDDRLVRELGKNIKNNDNNKEEEKEEKKNDDRRPFEISSNPNRNYLVVTSDRELTLRLNKIGVTCMKSGTFYKTYLKEYAFIGLENEDQSNDNRNDNKKDNRKSKDNRKFKDNKSNGKNRDKKDRKNKFKKDKKRGKKHWKKYIKNRFSDNSSSSNSSSSSSTSSSSNSSSSDSQNTFEKV